MQKHKILWFTGLSGAGKTTLAKFIDPIIKNSIILDGDDLRKGLCSDLGFSVEDRNENIQEQDDQERLSRLLLEGSRIHR